jgi:hypothetical protein
MKRSGAGEEAPLFAEYFLVGTTAITVMLLQFCYKMRLHANLSSS